MLPRYRLALALTLKLIALLLSLCCAQAAHAQAPGTGPDTLYHLHGTVLDGITSKPIARALVTSNDQRLAALTNNEGRFTLDISVPPPPPQMAHAQFPVMVSLAARKPGYFEKSSQPVINLANASAGAAIELKLMPAAAIAGRVSASRSNNPENVRVSLLRRAVQDGSFVWQQAGSQSTDAGGNFRFTNLEAGDYTVVTATWRENSAEGLQQLPPRVLPGQQPKPVEQYAPVFNGDVATLAATRLLAVRFGETTGVELHLHPATFYPIAVPVTLPTPTTTVQVTLAGGDLYKGFNLRYNEQAHTVTGFLPSGAYTLLLSGVDRAAFVPATNGPVSGRSIPATNQRSFASLPITISDATFHAAPVALAPGSALEVRIQTQFTAKTSRDFGSLQSFSGPLGRVNDTPRPPLNFYLRPMGPGANFFGMQQHATSAMSLILEDVQPDRYAIVAQPFNGYIASMTCGGVDLMRQPLVVHSGSMPPIDILLLDNAASITGTVTAAAASPAQHNIYLFATDGSGRMVQGFEQQRGTFTASNVPPGSYVAFAYDGQNTPPIPYRETDGLNALNGKGKTFTVAAGQQLEVELPLLSAADIEAR